MHDLPQQYRSLLQEQDELDEAITALSEVLQEAGEDDEQWAERREELAWLQRQQASVLVQLSELERTLLASGLDGWEEG
ncbi:MAG TPA: hypothetical protein PKI41_13035 [Candidatus Competibacteraceae bacterium]|nr:MAG: hypothetical protein EKK71_13755 [Candidatus Competibacteraceae bacterium]HOB63025.1 hypothetical protein [Candidatus Competibacteraceae bacterium]HQA26520.1 hypothetical protein [Candidatus Competibacteraceae bacterium]HQD57236.1 hypothetical protein [Candidatus Competibacteraceae bacterium]